MPVLRLYNTLGREIQEFIPIEPGKVGMYGCGPTVYNYAHIGNLRAYVFDDTLVRALRFLGYEVRHVMNITDVGHLTGDDAETGEDIQTVTALRVLLHADAQALVWAELDMFAGADGKPAYSHPLHIVDGEPVRGTFPFLVTEMRVAEADGA